MREAEEADFRNFVAARSSALLRLAVLLTGDRTWAEDILQTALIKTYLAWPRIERSGSVEAYTRRIIVRETVSWRRRRAASEVVTDRVPDRAGGDGSDGSDDRADRDVLWRALATLPSRQRAVIVLRFYADLSERDTAETLGCAVGTVKSHTSRALTSLRRGLAPTATPRSEVTP